MTETAKVDFCRKLGARVQIEHEKFVKHVGNLKNQSNCIKCTNTQIIAPINGNLKRRDMSKKNRYSLPFVVGATGLLFAAFQVNAQETTVTENDNGGTFSHLFGTSHFENEFGASIALKAWSNKWETSLNEAGAYINGEGRITDQAPGHVISLTSTEELTAIPTVSMRYRNLVFTGSYYPKTEFEFPLYTIPIENLDFDTKQYDAYLAQSKFTADREEWDATLGYYIHPNVALLLGYKKITQDFHSTTDIYHVVGNHGTQPPRTVESPSTTEISGPILGIAASLPIGGGFGLYGSYAYGFLKSDFDDGQSADSPYNLIEAGISYSHIPDSGPVSAVTGYLGYRSQIIRTQLSDLDDWTGNQEGPDATDGFTLGVSLAL